MIILKCHFSKSMLDNGFKNFDGKGCVEIKIRRK